MAELITPKLVVPAVQVVVVETLVLAVQQLQGKAIMVVLEPLVITALAAAALVRLGVTDKEVRVVLV
jgi:hypothetical protein